MKHSKPAHHGTRGGFTLVELILVIVIMAVIAASLAVVMRPALDAYVDSRVRAEISDQADSAIRRMLRDVRQAVPNSIRIPNTQCFELVPTSTGGRYRQGRDTTNDAASCDSTWTSACSAPLDPSQATTDFDTLTPLSTTPSANDWVVINNQNTSDVYAGVNTAQITNVQALNDTRGRLRISIASKQFPYGYDGGRFMVVPNSQRAVFYVCSGADGTVDSSGNGKGVLVRVKNYGFNAAYPTSCPAAASGDIVASRVLSCTFIYDPNQGATQQNGFIWLELTMTRNNESAHLAVGAHVTNSP
ncbi:MAG TPA: type II secretion system GspH family protein [Candidatus Aquabacterium excrementipullorum]|nr:type II secretion system GspH family protein [Candidatus Aquabacterium excrementipullorum]